MEKERDKRLISKIKLSFVWLWSTSLFFLPGRRLHRRGNKLSSFDGRSREINLCSITVLTAKISTRN